jgi:hypothetical protein
MKQIGDGSVFSGRTYDSFLTVLLDWQNSAKSGASASEANARIRE